MDRRHPYAPLARHSAPFRQRQRHRRRLAAAAIAPRPTAASSALPRSPAWSASATVGLQPQRHHRISHSQAPPADGAQRRRAAVLRRRSAAATTPTRRPPTHRRAMSPTSRSCRRPARRANRRVAQAMCFHPDADAALGAARAMRRLRGSRRRRDRSAGSWNEPEWTCCCMSSACVDGYLPRRRAGDVAGWPIEYNPRSRPGYALLRPGVVRRAQARAPRLIGYIEALSKARRLAGAEGLEARDANTSMRGGACHRAGGYRPSTRPLPRRGYGPLCAGTPASPCRWSTACGLSASSSWVRPVATRLSERRMRSSIKTKRARPASWRRCDRHSKADARHPAKAGIHLDLIPRRREPRDVAFASKDQEQ